MASHELTISINNDILEEIERYKESTHKQNIEEAVIELINYALS